MSSLLLELHRGSVVDNKLSLHLLKFTSVTNPFVFSTIGCSKSPLLHSRCQYFGLEIPWWLERTDENQLSNPLSCHVINRVSLFFWKTFETGKVAIQNTRKHIGEQISPSYMPESAVKGFSPIVWKAIIISLSLLDAFALHTESKTMPTTWCIAMQIDNHWTYKSFGFQSIYMGFRNAIVSCPW